MGGVHGRAGRQHGAGAVVRAHRVRGGGEEANLLRGGQEDRGRRGARAERLGEDAVPAVQPGGAAGGREVLLLRTEGDGVRSVGKIVLRLGCLFLWRVETNRNTWSIGIKQGRLLVSRRNE